MKPSDVRTSVPITLQEGRAVMIWGPSGAGKSDTVAQICSDHKWELRDVRLARLDPTDIKGFPTPDNVKKVMKWLLPDFLPTKGKGVLFLDEINSAPPAVQACAYSLVQDRRIGEYKLPDGWHIIAAGNRASDRSVVHTMPAALSNRFIHIDYEINNDDWNLWAMHNNIHLDIRGFAKFRPHRLHEFDPATNPRCFPTPRSWAFVNQIYGKGHSPAVELELIKGTVGESAAVEFFGYVVEKKDLPTVDQVLLDPDGTKVPAKGATKVAMMAALEMAATPGNLGRILKYAARMDTEFQTVFMRSAIRRDPKLMETKPYADWIVVNHAAMM